MPVTYGNAEDRGGVTILTPTDTGFSARACAAAPGTTGNVVNMAAFDRCAIFSNVTGAGGGIRLWPIVLAEDGVTPLTEVDGTGSPFWTLQPGLLAQDGNALFGLNNVALVRLVCYSITTVQTLTLRLFMKNRF